VNFLKITTNFAFVSVFNYFRAELTAIMKAIQLTKKDQKITIITDSMSSIQCIESRIIENQEPGRSLREHQEESNQSDEEVETREDRM
jgi:ribonuclease HI